MKLSLSLSRIRTNPQTVLFPILVGFTAFQLYIIWLGGFGIDYLRSFTNSEIERPYVYRALLPLMSRGMEWFTGISAISWLIVFVVAAGVGIYYSMLYFIEAFRDNNPEMWAFTGSELFFLLLVVSPHPYDVATGFFFTLSFALLARGKYVAYLALFPLATLNRETTFLLALLWAVWMFRKLPLHQYIAGGLLQVVAYGAIRYITRTAYAGNPGTAADWQPLHNLNTYAHAPRTTSALICLFAVTLYFVFRRWGEKPLFLRTAFAVLFPLQVLLHVTLGGAFEIRVYAEIFPLIWLLAQSLTYKLQPLPP